MKYQNNNNGKIVEVKEFTKDGYVVFTIDSIETYVAKNRFDKVYTKIEKDKK